MRFDHFSFGTIRIDGSTRQHDVVIDRGEVRKREKGPSKQFCDAFDHTPLAKNRDSIDPIVDVTPLPQQPLESFERCLHPVTCAPIPWHSAPGPSRPWLIALGLPVIIVAWFTVRRSKSVI